MPKIILPRVLAELAGCTELDVAGATVLEAVRSLKQFHAALPDRILSEKLEPRPHVLIFVDEEEVRTLQGAQTPLSKDAVLRIVPAVSGGGPEKTS